MTDITEYKAVPLITLMDNIRLYRYDPSNIQRAVLNHLENVTNGLVDLVDPTNPFIFLLEASCVNTAAAIIENEINTRKQYPALAQTEADLYVHMSDKDFLNRFATPVKTQFSFLIQFADLVNKMVDAPNEGCKKVTILRDTEFLVNDVAFTMHYPIHIRLFYNNILQVSYDNTIESPLLSLATNVIPYQIKTDRSGATLLYFDTDVLQVQATSTEFPLQASSYFSEVVGFQHSFCYARIWFKSAANNGVWKEMQTTHTDQVFDNTKPTAVLKVINGTLTVFIPMVYLLNNLIDGSLRVDVYTTQGEISMNMNNYSPRVFQTTLKAIDEQRDVTVYSNALNDVSYLAYSDRTVTGGTSELGFAALREQVINNAIGDQSLPITNVQIVSRIEKYGFDILRNIDNVTNRIYMASKELPKPLPSKLITPANLTINTLIVSLETLANIDEVSTNGDRATLHSKTVYKNDNGILSIYPAAEVTRLQQQLSTTVADTVSNAPLLYTPFYYVLDNSLDEFEVRAYHLDAPKAGTLNFVTQNPSTSLQVNTAGFSIEKTDVGYIFSTVVRSDTFYKKLDDQYVQAQLAYIPAGERYYAYVNGRISGLTTEGERIFAFDIITNHDLDTNHQLVMTNFNMFTNEATLTKCGLLQTFSVFYTTNSVAVDFVASSIDPLLGTFMLPRDVVGVTHETIQLTLGYSLKNLWSRSRSVASGLDYLFQTHDMPMTYQEDVYQVDPVTQSFLQIDQEGNVTYNLLHRKGDYVVDDHGNTVYAYRTGDVVLGADGKPVMLTDQKTVRYVDMMFIDGTYYFANDPVYVAYRKDVAMTLTTWITQDLAGITDLLLEQTKIFYYPKRSIGNVEVLIQNDISTTIEAMQSFTVDIYVTNTIYRDERIRQELERTTIEIMDTMIKAQRIAVSDIIIALRAAYSASVVTVKVTGLGGERQYEAVALLSMSDRLSLKKRLVSQEDGMLIVKEDVVVNFIEYLA